MYDKEMIDILKREGAVEPDKLWANLKKLITSPNSKINVIGAKQQRLGSVNILGTTQSGSPHLTTLGNTIRVIKAIQFAMHKGGVPSSQYVLRVSGDDAVMWVSEEWVFRAHLGIKKIFSLDNDPKIHGLGMVIEISENPAWRAEFCSKMLVTNTDNMADAQWVRKPQSLIMKGNHYVGNKEEFIKDDELYSSYWASSLKQETNGPIYTEIAELR